MLFEGVDEFAEVVYVVRGRPFAGRAKRLFEDNGLGNGFGVSADGRRFVVVETIKEPDPPTIRVVENWHEEFRGEQD